MNITYQQWLQLQLSNSYFQNGKSSVLRLAPLLATQKILKNFEVLLQENTGDFPFYAGQNADEAFDIGELAAMGDIYFEIISSDPHFFNYTELPFNGEENIYYFSNYGLEAGNPELSLEDHASQNDLINFVTGSLNIPLDPETYQVEIKDESGKVVFSDSVDGSANPIYRIPLGILTNGKYELFLDGSLDQTFFTTVQSLNMGTIGILHLNMDQIINTPPPENVYTINFLARSAYWKYQAIVAPSRNIDVTEMQIIGVDSKPYDGPVEENVGDQKAKAFTSKKAIAVRRQIDNHPQLHLKYLSADSREEQTMQMDLPNPNMSSLRKYQPPGEDSSFQFTTIIYV